MNYEQKYNAALEQAKKELKTCGSLNCDAARLIFRLFPQLREIEDEKIRKEIIGYLNSKVATAEETELLYFKRWITYLEKLKEQKPNIEICPHSIKSKSYLETGYPIEQKHVDELFEVWIDGWYNEHHRDGYITMDEREFKNFCRGIKNMYQQKPAEWSEEDEEILNELLDHCNTENATWYNWLKSLRPDSYKNCNSRWKPSEELMGCLERLIYFKNPEPEDIKGCEELYEQLKKLM